MTEFPHIRHVHFFVQVISRMLLSTFECKFSEHGNKSEWHVLFVLVTFLYWLNMLVTYQTPVIDYAQLHEWQYFLSSMMSQMLKVKLKSNRRFQQNSGEKLKVHHESDVQREAQEIITF